MAVSQAIRLKVEELASGTGSPQEVSGRIAEFVPDHISYYLDEWDVGAEEAQHQEVSPVYW